MIHFDQDRYVYAFEQDTNTTSIRTDIVMIPNRNASGSVESLQMEISVKGSGVDYTGPVNAVLSFVTTWQEGFFLLVAFEEDPVQAYDAVTTMMARCSRVTSEAAAAGISWSGLCSPKDIILVEGQLADLQ